MITRLLDAYFLGDGSIGCFYPYQINTRCGRKQASEQASKQTSKQASKQVIKLVNKEASK